LDVREMLAKEPEQVISAVLREALVKHLGRYWKMALRIPTNFNSYP
jgi:hypothetical protein